VKHLAFALLTTSLMTNLSIADNYTKLTDKTDKINYSVGYQIGSDFRLQEIEIRPDAIIHGIKDALEEATPLMSAEEMRKAMADLGQRVADLKAQKRQEQLQKRLEENLAFLEANAKKEGVVTTPSGLQYRVIEQGGGKHPKPTDTVLVTYRGRLLDGIVFDSSYEKNKPVSFEVDKLIKGWSEALQLMQRGDHWQLFIPPDLAYGEEGAPPRIPPNSALIFDVELISIQEQQP
jgi:FKBP-type peptidyl-prolyl cis-trans isomerase FklB